MVTLTNVIMSCESGTYFDDIIIMGVTMTMPNEQIRDCNI